VTLQQALRGYDKRLGSFRGRTRGNGVSIVKVFNNAHELAVHALWTAMRTIFRQNCIRLQAC